MALVQTGVFNFMQWLTNHGPQHTRPALDSVINALKEQGVKSFAAVGYCFGGKRCITFVGGITEGRRLSQEDMCLTWHLRMS